MGRKILFITTDQMRYDALGCNGGVVARTPVIDGLAECGVRYHRAHNQSVVCMPARSSMLTGQYVRTHGVWMNGVPLPADAPSVARELNEQAGYRTALIGKAHFEPHVDFKGVYYENQMARRGEFGPHRGFEHMELATHSPLILHYGTWLRNEHPEAVGSFYPNLTSELRVNHAGGGDTGACQVHSNAVARELYHTDWVAERTIAYLDSLPDDADWFVWMSFPDPHHPWDPPASEKDRVRWRDIDVPAGFPKSPDEAARILADKPHHWLDYFEGRNVSNMEAPPGFRPRAMTSDQLREIDALTHVENELIDEACGRVLDRIREKGWESDTDIIFTTDHGELQGDFGLLFKGPYHVDALMRIPLIWRPAPNATIAPAVVDEPVGHVDLAPTFCQIAGLEAPDWMQGRALPRDQSEANTQDRQRVLTEWDSDFEGDTLHLRTIYRDGYTCTVYEGSSLYQGSEGELYDHSRDPLQRENLWSDPAYESLRSDLVADLYDSLPPEPDERAEVVAPV
jgi:arylsulfatase A-like enzyme